MELICNKKYLLLPASHHAVKKRLLFFSGDKLVYDLAVSLDYDQPDYLFPVHMARFMGQTLRVECDQDVDLHFQQTDKPPLDYAGKYRPLIHFTARRGWINDPNGLVYHNGKYRMYYQHNPAATTWENMHWGACESEDLIHWRELEETLFPDEQGTMFSGSGMVDWQNASGLMKDGQPPLLFFYTCAGNTSETSKDQPFTQCLAYSHDGGKTLVKYSGNPLVTQFVDANRDPKVIHFAEDNSYIMAIFLDDHDFMLLKSNNLLDWQEIQRIRMPEDAECPDFYPLPADGDPAQTKWVLSAASDRYFIGSFDGRHFTPETELLQLNFGNASYAAQSWSDLPGNRRVRTAFASVVIPGMPFGSCMNVPQQMKLKTVHGQLRLCAWPVDELRSLYQSTQTFSSFPVNGDIPFRHQVHARACDITLRIKADTSFRLSLFGLEIRYDAALRLLHCQDRQAPVRGVEGTVELRVLYDTVYAELFADEGSVFMGMTYMQDTALNRLTISAEGAAPELLTVSELNAFWK